MSIYDTLNEQQKLGVITTEGPVLILAGAGSGKTRVLTHRTAYLIEEKGVNPYNIMAITFTNKAAGEMRERIDALVGYGSESIWVSTFHSTCVRILRRHIDRIGYDTNFTIYDSDDSKSVMKEICKRLNIDTKIYKERSLLAAISSAKDELVSPTQFALQAAASSDFAKKKQAQVYQEYQAALQKNNALDFDDLIVKTVELLQTDPEVLAYYQERFRYIMVDEYQDTNTAQFELIRLLAGKYKNLCVVGDDDQSIYKFRGANIYNILNFEKHFPDAVTIKLEQNYRSTQNILNAANSVIANNVGRKAKTLWTANGEGEKIDFEQFDTAYEEADYVARDIASGVREGKYGYGDYAVLYRTNAQSRLFEERFIVSNIPYKIVGGVNFYARKEVKDHRGGSGCLLSGGQGSAGVLKDDRQCEGRSGGAKNHQCTEARNWCDDAKSCIRLCGGVRHQFLRVLKACGGDTVPWQECSENQAVCDVYSDDAQQAAVYRCGGSAQRGDRGDGLREGA